MERPATGGTPPAPLPPAVSGYAVFDLSGCPPPRMLSAVQVRSGFECTSSLQAAVTLHGWMTLQCATAEHSCEAECSAWQESSFKTAPDERQGNVTSCALFYPPAPVMRVCSALGLSLRKEERCRSGTVLQGPHANVECTELQEMCVSFASCHAIALKQRHPPLWQSAALVFLAEEGQIHGQRGRRQRQRKRGAGCGARDLVKCVLPEQSERLNGSVSS